MRRYYSDYYTTKAIFKIWFPVGLVLGLLVAIIANWRPL